MSPKLGLVTPVLTLLPGAHARWERDAGFDEVIAISRAADHLGFDHLTCSEHVVVPTDVAAVRGGRYFDPLATFGYLAAVTQQIRLATSVLVLGYHHPLGIAKQYGTLDQVSGGRLVLGVGVGSLREEFDLLGAEFADRGERADDALRALRVALSSNAPSYRGRHYAFDHVVLDPSAGQPHVPIWVGGRSARSLRRAVELADGWCPFGLTPSEISELLDRHGRPRDIVLQSDRAFDPLGDADDTRRRLGDLAEIGATHVTLRIVSRSVAHYVDQLTALADMAGQ